MDASETVLFRHTCIMIKLLNSFTDKENITSPHILRRLDYLYERLSDFLGRELEEWWSGNLKKESASICSKTPQHVTTQPSMCSEIPQRFITQTPKSNEEPVNFLPSGKSGLVQSHFDSAQITGSSPSVKSANLETPFDVRITGSALSFNTKMQPKNSKIIKSAQSSNLEHADNELPSVESPNFKSSEYAQVTDKVIPVSPSKTFRDTENKYNMICRSGELLCNSNGALSSKEQVQGTVNQQITKENVKNSAVNINAKGHVKEKARTDIGKYIKERITTYYMCSVCKGSNFDCVRSHISESTHLEKMRQEKGIEVAETKTTISICEKIITEYHCTLCLVNTSSVKNMRDHMTGQLHSKNLLQDISDPNIGTAEKESYYCKICSVKLSSVSSANDHLLGKPHGKKLKAHVQEKEGQSLQNVCEIQKNKHLEAQFKNFNDIYMICNVCNVYVLKIHVEDHIKSTSHYLTTVSK